MEVDPVAVARPGIAALPSTTVRQIGSQQVIIDPSSVVKELIDNSLDARAKSIFVDITANTISSIQVKDDGHGVPAEDRTLMCRRYCTSKIRSFHDLKDVGRKWLGFRGEALASIAATSGAVLVTTRVEGEPVAVQLEYGRNGELSTTKRASHPVGTTVKVTNVFEPTPVRIQSSLNNSTKCLAKIRRLMQAYALARPTVRFKLHVLKAKHNKGDFIYAPKASANVEDAVLKIIGKDCGLQCNWTALETEHFEVHALLPRPTANGTKIANHGAFISVDSRPMSNSRGVPKQIVTAFKGRLRKANPSFGTVREPFFCMNIICPPDSYDPNLEPAKDDVIFTEDHLVMSAVDKLFISFYPEAVVETEKIEPSTSAQQSQEMETEERPARSATPISVYEDTMERINEPSSYQQGELPRWRSSMYGIDEDDLEFLQEEQPPVVDDEEEGDRRAKDVSNPWTIARMNAATKPRKLIGNGQLPSPSKSPSKSPDDITLESSSSVVVVTPRRTPLVEPLTPQTVSRTNLPRSSLDEELECSIQHLPRLSSEQRLMRSHSGTPRERGQSSISPSEVEVPVHIVQGASQRPNMLISESNPHSFVSARSLHSSLNVPDMPASASTAPHRRRRKQQTHNNTELSSPTQGPSDMWFGQPMPGPESSRLPCRPKRLRKQGVPLFPSDDASSFRRSVLPAADQPVENNSDIRNFFGQKLRQQRSNLRDNFQGLSFNGSSKATSAVPQTHLDHTGDQLLLRSDRDGSLEPQDIAKQLRAYVEREAPPLPQCLSREALLEPNGCSNDGRNPFSIRGGISIGPESHSMGSPFSTGRTDEVPTTPGHKPYSDFQNNTQNMDSSLKAHLSHEAISTNQPNKQAPSPDPHITPSHPPTKPHPTRRQTTDTAHRTKSSKLPLEHMPRSQRLQNVILPVSTSIQSILQCSQQLDMRHNSLKWGRSTNDTLDVFSEPVDETKMKTWVVRINDMVRATHRRVVDGMEVQTALQEGIQRALRTRNKHADMADEVAGVMGTQHLSSASVRYDESRMGHPDVVNGDIDVSIYPSGGCDGHGYSDVGLGNSDDGVEDDDDDDMLMGL